MAVTAYNLRYFLHIVRPKDNLTTPDEKFHTPQREKFGPAEKRTPIRHDDNLYLSGEFTQREVQEYIRTERPTQGMSNHNETLEY